MRFVDPADPRQGLVFEGRLAEDFKLSSGTWVSVGPLRREFWRRAGIRPGRRDRGAGSGRMSTALIFPNLALCRTLCGAATDAPARDVLDHPAVRARFTTIVADLAAQNTGSSTFVARAIVLDEPPSTDGARDHRQGIAQPEGGAGASQHWSRSCTRRTRRRASSAALATN